MRERREAYQNLINALLGLSKGRKEGIYRTLGGRVQDDADDRE